MKATEVLIDLGADMNAMREVTNKTPLQLAQQNRENQWEEVVEFLRSRGANGSDEE